MTDRNPWRPAVIVPARVLDLLHTRNPGTVTRYAGEKILVRQSIHATRSELPHYRQAVGCPADEIVVVHPDDTNRLWPEFENTPVAICTCYLYMD